MGIFGGYDESKIKPRELVRITCSLSCDYVRESKKVTNDDPTTRIRHPTDKPIDGWLLYVCMHENIRLTHCYFTTLFFLTYCIRLPKYIYSMECM
jgi:hypothetical protein